MTKFPDVCSCGAWPGMDPTCKKHHPPTPIGTPYRKRKTPLSSLLPKVIYMHVMDNTENIPGNRPSVLFTTNKKNPFGVPGEDYSVEYPWTFIKFVPQSES
jgi:hypothetical protein